MSLSLSLAANSCRNARSCSDMAFNAYTHTRTGENQTIHVRVQCLQRDSPTDQCRTPWCVSAGLDSLSWLACVNLDVELVATAHAHTTYIYIYKYNLTHIQQLTTQYEPQSCGQTAMSATIVRDQSWCRSRALSLHCRSAQ